MWPKVITKQPVFETDPDLYAALNLTPKASRQEIDEAYKSIIEADPRYEQVRHLAWKLLRDPLYKKLWDESGSLKYVYDAGFFIDRVLPQDVGRLEFVPGLLTTPLHKIIANIAEADPKKTPIVLLTTGGLSPVHYGHVAMMEVSKQELEKAGHVIVGGYLSPSHDDYVSTKYSGEAELNSDHRIYLSQLATNSSDWLMVDPWESRYVHTDLNFTDIIYRLEEYLNYYVKHPKKIEVYYVFGADNAKFARVFKENSGCVCIGRNSSLEGLEEFKKEKGIAKNKRIVFTENLTSYANISSSAARKWKPNLMPDDVSNEYFRWRKNILSADGVAGRPKKLYIVRDEDSWAVESWMNTFGAGKVLTAKEKFRGHLLQSLHGAFLYPLMPDLPLEIEARTYHLDEQMQYVDKLKRSENVLNLDVCTNSESDVNMSREFNLADGQPRSRSLIARPGYIDIESQLKNIPAGEYTLIDDDLATGSTINMLMGLLPETVRISKIRTLLDHSRRMYNRRHPGALDLDVYDVVDLRDFIIGSKAGGLVVRLPNGEMARAPYMQPYVSLISRASVPPSSEMSLSKRLWEMNKEFFEQLGGEVRISDLDEFAQKLFLFAGFSADTYMTDVCQWHLDKVFYK